MEAPTVVDELRVAVVIPCHNEAPSIACVVGAFRRELPFATIYVYDNASTDDTGRVARNAGAVVRNVRQRGKGNVVRRMLADVEGDVYVMVDGDGTYDPSSVRDMVALLLNEQLDMVVGAREPISNQLGVYRKGHTRGNALFTRAVRVLFGGDFTDVFSGYRVMSRRFVKSLPVSSEAFEIETELCAHATRVRANCAELTTPYGIRSEGSESKLHTYSDGFKILSRMVWLFEEMRPFQFFGACAAVLTVVALVLGIPVIDQFAHSGLVLRFPTAILAVSIQIIAFLLLMSGIILRAVARSRDEARRLRYLQLPAPGVRSQAVADGLLEGSTRGSADAFATY